MKYIRFIRDYLNEQQDESLNENRTPDYKYLVKILLQKQPDTEIHWDNNRFMLTIAPGVKLDKRSLPEYFGEPISKSSDIQSALLLAHKNSEETKKQVEKLSRGQIEVTFEESAWILANGGRWVKYRYVG